MGTSEIVFGVVSFFGALLGMMAKDFFSHQPLKKLERSLLN